MKYITCCTNIAESSQFFRSSLKIGQVLQKHLHTPANIYTLVKQNRSLHMVYYEKYKILFKLSLHAGKYELSTDKQIPQCCSPTFDFFCVLKYVQKQKQ